MIISLSKPIQAHGNEVKKLELREPNGGDVAAAGFPFRFVSADDQTMSVLPEAAAITSLISRLGDIPRGLRRN